MNKGQLVEAVQKNLGKDTTKAAAEAALNAVITSITKAVKKENVQIREMTILERSNLLEKVKEFHNNFFLQFPKMNFNKEI